ncbi:PR-1-like protein [Pluteus cervinus]|uniref:PR-1-like protein n=1 Tax=Pluteus cervinus TaxID=181527 RepID=A0ACD3AI22_9AGAR|nr:PR-1-like protein [Pluteus cervinus]
MFSKLSSALCFTLFLVLVSAQVISKTTDEKTTSPTSDLPAGRPLPHTIITLSDVGNDFATQPTAASVSQFLDAHNGYRSQFGARNITYNSGLFQGTYNWAIQCKFLHSAPNGAYGEDLYAATYSNTNYYSATYSWVVTEYPKYNYSTPGFSEATGHFTQVVWLSTTGVACATALCPANTIFSGYQAYFIVCRYSPAGNVQGQFPQNVRRLGTAVSKHVEGAQQFVADPSDSTADPGSSTQPGGDRSIGSPEISTDSTTTDASIGSSTSPDQSSPAGF